MCFSKPSTMDQKLELFDALPYVGYVKTIAGHFLSSNDPFKTRLRRKMKNRTVEDIQVLQTMLGTGVISVKCYFLVIICKIRRFGSKQSDLQLSEQLGRCTK